MKARGGCFNSLLAAIFDAFTHASEYKLNISFEILVEPGNHWIKRSDIDFYLSQKSKFTDIQMEHGTFGLVIRTD
jgi:hypothetical protein